MYEEDWSWILADGESIEDALEAFECECGVMSDDYEVCPTCGCVESGCWEVGCMSEGWGDEEN